MKKKLLFLFLLSCVIASLYAAEDTTERIWFMITSNNAPAINLGENEIPPAKYGAIWDSGKSTKATQYGYYVGTLNVLCNVGIANTDHQILFEFSTSGRFVSETDPAAYRDFYIVAKPKIRYGSADREYWFTDSAFANPTATPSGIASGTDHGIDELCPNTKTDNVIQVYSPQLVVHHSHINEETGETVVDNNTYYYLQNAFGGDNNTSYSYKGSYTKGNGYTNVATRFYFDILLALDPLQENGVDHTLHLIEDDNYFATVTVSARCTVPGCSNPEHFLNYSFIVRGYYKSNKPNLGQLFMFVHPEAQSTNLDLESILADQNNVNSSFDFSNNNEVKAVISENAKVAELEVISLPDKNIDWKSKVTVLVTASPSISAKNTSNSTTFALKHTDSDISIPFKLVVKNKNTDEIQVFDGSSPASKIDLASSQSEVPDKQNVKYKSINYGGDVYVVLKDEATGRITEMVNGHTVVYTKVKISDYLSDDEHTGLTGLYSSYIYYHIFKD